ncbi:hypothetical protein KFL_002650020 [Klebsormidium nitens]|uniref:RWD domain-containing protein n=1 Tax=Klebsormidium nitens TaxID=105231 RepID=A0A1Y1IBC6_KLENI|nr:hypothetical protein KFL_002650020 [Klebsormidium nitens]|eukprot:GAQ86006.1 hypothetical protein KFL_002650020 [Klebsormidium nitens]
MPQLLEVSAEDRTAQIEELEVLQSIYGEQCSVATAGDSCEIRINPLEASDASLLLQVHLPEDYPSCSPPVAELEAPWLTPETRERVWQGMAAVYSEDPGEPVLFRWTEWIKEQDSLWEAADSWHKQRRNEARDISDRELARGLEEESLRQEIGNRARQLATRTEAEEAAGREMETKLGIVHGSPFVDRKSTFQAHLAEVHSSEDVERAMQALLANRKIAGATHNIMAFRIHQDQSSSFLQDCDDDGEAAAGGRLLHLLQIVDARNVMVVVSRWFGGTLLGPDRFKHINNVARAILEECGHIKGKGDNPKSTKGKKR